MKLRVVRPAGGNQGTGAGSSATATVTSPAIATFDTRLPVRSGDNVGIDLLGSATVGARPNGGAAEAVWVPPLADGQTRSPNFVNNDVENLFNADLEPDADRDGHGDETQDRCSKDPSTQGLCRGPCANDRRGTPGPDILPGTTAGDRILGLSGNDIINGFAGDDCLQGDAGNDRLGGASGRDRLSGGFGRDRLSGGRGNDRLSGGPSADRMTGGPGRNRLSGGAGNDVLNSKNRRRERVSCGPGRDRIRADRTDRLSGCERVRR
jgi:Ca2+-binding RTX toxin-like protein